MYSKLFDFPVATARDVAPPGRDEAIAQSQHSESERKSRSLQKNIGCAGDAMERMRAEFAQHRSTVDKTVRPGVFYSPQLAAVNQKTNRLARPTSVRSVRPAVRSSNHPRHRRIDDRPA